MFLSRVHVWASKVGRSKYVLLFEPSSFLSSYEYGRAEVKDFTDCFWVYRADIYSENSLAFSLEAADI